MTFSGAKNSAGDIVPAFIRAKPSIAAWLPWIAPSSSCNSGGGSSSVAAHVLAPGTERPVSYHLMTEGDATVRIADATVPIRAGDVLIISPAS